MKKKTRKKVFSTIITIAIIIFLAWVGISWLEICCKNLTTCNYSDWNAIVKFIELYNK